MTIIPIPQLKPEVHDDEQRIVLRAIVNSIRHHNYDPAEPKMTALRLHRLGFRPMEIERHLDEACQIVREGR
jgi:hypothetical protein